MPINNLLMALIKGIFHPPPPQLLLPEEESLEPSEENELISIMINAIKVIKRLCVVIKIRKDQKRIIIILHLLFM
jgi:hypothetical protein